MVAIGYADMWYRIILICDILLLWYVNFTLFEQILKSNIDLEKMYANLFNVTQYNIAGNK